MYCRIGVFYRLTRSCNPPYYWIEMPSRLWESQPGRSNRAHLSKTARIYQALRNDILTMLLPPGTILVENALAARFAVSKTPIREALALLQQDRLIDSLPRKGYLVTAVTVEDQRELIELRAAIDGAAAELTAHRMTREQL